MGAEDPGVVPSLQAVLIFTHDEVELNADDAPMPAIHIKKLKDFMRQRAKPAALTAESLARVNAAFSDSRSS